MREKFQRFDQIRKAGRSLRTARNSPERPATRSVETCFIWKASEGPPELRAGTAMGGEKTVDDGVTPTVPKDGGPSPSSERELIEDLTSIAARWHERELISKDRRRPALLRAFGIAAILRFGVVMGHIVVRAPGRRSMNCARSSRVPFRPRDPVDAPEDRVSSHSPHTPGEELKQSPAEIASVSARKIGPPSRRSTRKDRTNSRWSRPFAQLVLTSVRSMGERYGDRPRKDKSSWSTRREPDGASSRPRPESVPGELSSLVAIRRASRSRANTW